MCFVKQNNGSQLILFYYLFTTQRPIHIEVLSLALLHSDYILDKHFTYVNDIQFFDFTSQQSILHTDVTFKVLTSYRTLMYRSALRRVLI